MNHYIMIRRLRGPAILLLIGGVWLLHASGVIYHPWSWFWPLLLIMLGVFMLAERTALADAAGHLPGVLPRSAQQEKRSGRGHRPGLAGTAHEIVFRP